MGLLVAVLVGCAGAGALLLRQPARNSAPRPAAPGGVQGWVRERLALEPVLQAEQRLAASPADPAARMELAQTCAHANDPAGAALALYPLLKGSPTSEQLSLYIRACSQLGWLDEAEAAVKRLTPLPTPVRLTLAGTYVGRGRKERAVALLQAADTSSLSPDAWLSGAAIWLQCRQPKLAVEWAERGVRGLPDNPGAAALLARCRLAAGQPEAALAALPPASGDAEAAATLEFWRGRAEVRSSTAATREAGRQRLSRIVASDPQNGVAAFEAGRAALQAKQPRAAAALLAAALRAGYQPVLTYELFAQTYSALGRKREAAWAQGNAEMLRGRVADAAVSFRRSVELDPSKPSAYIELAKALAAAGQPQAALGVLERARKVAPQSLDIALLKASVYGRLERVKEQAAELEAAAQFGGQRANEPLGELGKVYYNSQQFDRAVPFLEQAVQRDEGDAYSHLYLGLTAARRLEDPRQAESAVRHLIRAAEADPTYFYPWMNAGSTLMRMGFVAEAAGCFRRAINGDSRWEGPYLSLSQALQRLSRMPERALALQLYAKARRLEAARLQLENAVSKRPRDAAARYAAGNRLLLDGQVQEAFGELLQAISLSPGAPHIRSRFADVCALLDYDDLRQEAERVAH